jgi:hypothetical protein
MTPNPCPPGLTPGTVRFAALGEGWDNVDDDVPLIDVLSSIIAAVLARVCRERSFF